MTTQQFGGQWTVEKLEILRQYLDSYTTALKDQPFNLIYVDGFAGPGVWSPGTEYGDEDYGEFREVVEGSATIALNIDDKPFDRFVFIEMDPDHANSLRRLRSEHPQRQIEIINGDCNIELPRFCDSMGRYDRAVVFLDPFAADVDWRTVETIANTKKIDCWILFPLMAITRMMTKSHEPPPAWQDKLDKVFGGREHWQGVYSEQPTLFGDSVQTRRPGSEQFSALYRQRLKTVFTRVADTERILRNSTNMPLFSLCFAASNPRGAPIAIKIADHILRNW